MKRSHLMVGMLTAAVSLYFMMMSNARAELSLLQLLDLDKDGAISLKEAVARPSLLEVFGDIDQNADGKITLAELQALEFSKQHMLADLAETAPSKSKLLPVNN